MQEETTIKKDSRLLLDILTAKWLFSTKGRCPRMKMFLTEDITSFAAMLVFIVCSLLVRVTDSLAGPMILNGITILTSLLQFAITVCVGIRRWKDMDKKMWIFWGNIALFVMIYPVIWLITGHITINARIVMPAGLPIFSNWKYTLFTVYFWTLFFWTLYTAFYCIFIRGTKGPNQYGEDPLELIEDKPARFWLLVGIFLSKNAISILFSLYMLKLHVSK